MFILEAICMVSVSSWYRMVLPVSFYGQNNDAYDPKRRAQDAGDVVDYHVCPKRRISGQGERIDDYGDSRCQEQASVIQCRYSGVKFCYRIESGFRTLSLT